MKSSIISLVTKDLLLTGRYSDFTITCNGLQFPVHQAVVCSQSPFFDAAICGHFQEAFEKTINLPDDDADTIRRMISYLYLQDYDQDGDGSIHQGINETATADLPTSESFFGEANLLEISETDEVPYNNLRVYMAADKFGIDPLKDLARDRLTSWLRRNWYAVAFPQVVRSVLETLPAHESQIPESIAHFIAGHAGRLLKCKQMLNLLQEFGSLTTAVLKEVVRNFQNSEVEHEQLVALCKEDRPGNGLRTTVNENPKCRHCKATFNLQVDDSWVVRCGMCRTRH